MYIKREDMHSVIEKDRDFGWFASDGTVVFSQSEVHEMLNKIPSADVAEVKHARWVRRKHHVGMGITIPIIECSLCGAITPVTEVERWNYCIGCGARMDG